MLNPPSPIDAGLNSQKVLLGPTAGLEFTHGISLRPDLRGLCLGTLDPAPDPCYMNRIWWTD